jgi:hypothetical protein
MNMAAHWAHWDLLLQARAAGVQWTESLTAVAASRGHLRLLQRLRQAGCPWDEAVVDYACFFRYENIVIWALNNGAPTSGSWLETATRWDSQQVLRWAWEHGRLPADTIPELQVMARNCGKSAIATWLDSLLAASSTSSQPGMPPQPPS